MVIRLCKNSGPGAIILVVLLSAVAWYASWQISFKIADPDGMPFYDLAWDIFKIAGHRFAPILGFLLTTTQAIHLNQVLNRHNVLYKNTWIPALIYTVLIGLLPPFLWFHPVLMVNTVMIFVLDLIFSLYKNERVLNLDFNAGFLLGIASLIYFPSVVLFFFFMISIIILRSVVWRDLLAAIMGFLIPFFFAFLYYFLSDRLDDFYKRLLLYSINKTPDIRHIFSMQYAYSLVLVAVLYILSILRLQSNYYKNVTKSRLIQQLLLVMLVAGFVIIIFTNQQPVYRFSLLVIPVSVYISYYFLSGKKNWLNELVFFILAASWIYNYFIA